LATFPFFARLVKAPAPLHAATPLPRLGSGWLVRALLWSVGWLALGAALTVLAYQLPARHTVAVGRNDESYVQGFADATNRWGVVTDKTGATEPYRWSGSQSALIFPQVGLPAQVSIRWRGWRPPGSAAPRVRVLLNGRDELGSFVATGDWETHTFRVDEGLWKPRDLFLQLEVEPAPVVEGMSQGVQVDRAVLETSGWPIAPYPAQVLGAAVATLLAGITFQRRPRLAALASAGMAFGFLGLYRLQLTPYPWRLFWPVMIGVLLCAIAARRIPWVPAREHGLRLSRRAMAWPALADGTAAATIVLWWLGLWWAGRAHVVLSIPGVEKDFRVFATRSDMLVCPSGANLEAGCVLRADGFYQLGYPFLLWLTRPFVADNAFLAGRIVAGACAAAFLLGAYLLGRTMLGPGAGLLALGFVALNRWTTEYALLLGTDMPFAAAWSLGLATLMLAPARRWAAPLAGMLCGLAFTIRHPGLVLLPLGCAFLLLAGRDRRRSITRWQGYRWNVVASFVAGFLIVSMPQIAVNLVDTGNPFYSQQAKNIWLAVYGNTDWGRWGEASNDVRLGDVIAHAPRRFLGNWWGNVRAFWGAGSEDTSEFGRALGIRLLSFPANLLALAGIVLWIGRGAPRQRFLLGVVALYMGALAVGFMLPRFVLPLLPIWGVAAAATLHFLWMGTIDQINGARRRRLLAGATLLALLLVAGSPGAGVRSALGNQDPDAVAAANLLRRTLGEDERFVAQLPPEDSLAKYSAVAHLAAPASDPAARYALRAPARPNEAGLIGRTGRYTLVRLAH
jgi:hypothetical protein